MTPEPTAVVTLPLTKSRRVPGRVAAKVISLFGLEQDRVASVLLCFCGEVSVPSGHWDCSARPAIGDVANDFILPRRGAGQPNVYSVDILSGAPRALVDS